MAGVSLGQCPRVPHSLPRNSTAVKRKPGLMTRLCRSAALACRRRPYWFVALSLSVAAVEGAVHTPFVVMLDQPVKSLLRCQALVNIDCDGRVADGQRRAVVCLFVGDVHRHF